MTFAFSPKQKQGGGKTLGQEDHKPKIPLHKTAAKGEPPPEGEQEAGEDVSHQDIHEVVAQHGPAQKIEMEHDHEGGQHHKTSHHGGAMHKSTHGTAKEAHDEAAAAAGIDGAPDSPEAESEGGEMALPGMKHKGY